MSDSRRNFLKEVSTLTLAGISFPLFSSAEFRHLKRHLSDYNSVAPEAIASDEDFWFYVQHAYTPNPNFVNLNNGGVCPQPKVVQEAFEHYNRLANEAPAYYLFTDFEKKRVSVRRKLAKLAGCSSDEINLCRNTTEALETLIFGVDLKRGDEVITTNQDYPHILLALDQRSRREGIKVNKISLPVPATDNDEIVDRFEKAITSKTKFIVVSHVVYMTGQILPVREICDMAHKHGVEVIVDGAHSFAHLDFRIPDLHCDYFGTSLHKWLGAPFGCGMLYIKKGHIGKVWSLFGSPEEEKNDMMKFDHLGTRSFPAELAISHAIDFHNGIGIERKQARLHYLKAYWADAVKDIKAVHFNTNLNEGYSGAIANFYLDGYNVQDVYKKLFNEHKLYTTQIHHDEFQGVRISPNIYTTTESLDQLVRAIREMVK